MTTGGETESAPTESETTETETGTDAATEGNGPSCKNELKYIFL